jgi:osmotically-inducible protein OsmY
MMEIGVAVDEAVVRLTGTVTSRCEWLAAQETALHVAGVRDVRNDIQVKGPAHRLPDRPRLKSRPR